MNIIDFDSIQLSLASPEEILSWSSGEITKPETINYRSQKPEKEGLFSEQVFGPVKDYECSCGKYRGMRYRGIVCDKCHVEITRSIVRRQRMGHVDLSVPVAHIWFLRNIPSRVALVLDKTLQEIERVIYYSSYIITEVDDELRRQYMKQMENEYKKKYDELTGTEGASEDQIIELKEARDQNMDYLNRMKTHNVISEVDYRIMSGRFGGAFKAETGSGVLRQIFEQIDLEQEVARLEEELENTEGAKARKLIKKIRFFGGMLKAGVRPEWMFLTQIPVIPPDLRPLVSLDGGRFATSDLNDLYRRVINRNNRLKKLQEINAPEVIVRNEKRMLQESVDALIDNSMRQRSSTSANAQRRPLKSLADVLKGKTGRFRQNLLGKRVDYSGRSVIVVGPNLNIDECGIPKEMALELFKPFIINRLIEAEEAHNIRGASRLIEQRLDIVWDKLDEVIQDKYVLLNRAPTLHRLGIQAFKPVLIEGKAIQLHPLVCSPYNADFDGDQMAVHVPLSSRTIKEAEELMLSSRNLIKPSSGDPSTTPGQDIVLGVYFVTKMEEPEQAVEVFRDFNEAVKAYDHGHIGFRQPVEIRKEPSVGEEPVTTTVGRIHFNEVLPAEFEFLNQTFNKKDLKKLTARLLQMYPQEEVGEVLDRIKDFGFANMTQSGLSWGMDDFALPEGKEEIISRAQKSVDEVNVQYQEGLLTRRERYAQIVDTWTQASTEIAEFVQNNIDTSGPVYDMIASGSRGSFGQLTQMVGMKGLVVNPSGNVIESPITSNFMEGLSEMEYFISTHGTRKGMVDTALKTASSGYLTRRLVDVCQDIVVKEEDCGDEAGLRLYRKDAEFAGDTFENFVFGRVILEDIHDTDGNVLVEAGQDVSRHQAQTIDESGVESARLRSVITCKTIRGLCQKCFGYDLGRNRVVDIGEAVGIVTAQAIGEPGTQLTMNTFHQGGAAGAADVTKGLPRVEELFEARAPKTPAIMSEVNGEVVEIKDVEGKRQINVRVEDVESGKDQIEVVTYNADPEVDHIIVQVGAKVRAGDPLTEGHLDLEKLYNTTGFEMLARYIIRQILGVYTSQGEAISNKHIEMIIRQMTSRYQVTDGGSSEFLKGQIVTKDQYNEFNRNRSEEEAPLEAEPLLQGITKVALNTESFMSAASFQNTTKILIDAALFGQEDKLRGLKENVIIGRLVPAGTGFRKDVTEREQQEEALSHDESDGDVEAASELEQEETAVEESSDGGEQAAVAEE